MLQSWNAAVGSGWDGGRGCRASSRSGLSRRAWIRSRYSRVANLDLESCEWGKREGSKESGPGLVIAFTPLLFSIAMLQSVDYLIANVIRTSKRRGGGNGGGDVGTLLLACRLIYRA